MRKQHPYKLSRYLYKALSFLLPGRAGHYRPELWQCGFRYAWRNGWTAECWAWCRCFSAYCFAVADRRKRLRLGPNGNSRYWSRLPAKGKDNSRNGRLRWTSCCFPPYNAPVWSEACKSMRRDRPRPAAKRPFPDFRSEPELSGRNPCRLVPLAAWVPAWIAVACWRLPWP